MSESDIYKERERIQLTKDEPRRRRRRSSSKRVFDETNRRRRSKNSGLRRILHLSRKGENERFFWWGLLVVIVVLLTIAGIWQFWVLEVIAEKQSREYEARVPIQQIPAANLPAEESP